MQHKVKMEKLIVGVMMGAMLSAEAGEQSVRFKGSDGNGNTGSICLPEHWEGGQIPSGKTIGLINANGKVWAGQPLKAVSIRQTGGLVGGRGLTLRGGAAGSGLGALYEINDPNPSYEEYVSLKLTDEPLVLWSAFGESVRIRLLSGRIETSELRMNSLAESVIDIQNGIFHVGKWTVAKGMIKMLSAGSGSLLIDELSCNLNEFTFDFQSGNSGRIVIGAKAGGESAAGIWQWLINNRKIRLDGKPVTEPAFFEIKQDGTSTSIRLAPGTVIVG